MTPSLALADVHRITTTVRGRDVDVFVFDHHRTAFTIWCHVATQLGRPLTLLSLDRHLDLEPPRAAAPRFDRPLAELDAFARHQLAPSNDDHIRAALDAGAIDRALLVARSHAPADLARLDKVTVAPDVARAARVLAPSVAQAADLVLDLDLDCFTTRSDGHPDEVLAWDAELVDAFLRPPGSAAFWDDVLARTRVVTIAREPYHCGGFVRGAKLWLEFSRVFFEGLLGVPSP